MKKQLLRGVDSLSIQLKKQLLHVGSIVMLCLLFSFSTEASAQSGPEVLKDWTVLEEADFHFDVSYAVVSCKGKATVIMNAFNESGAHPKVGFNLTFSDASGKTAEVTIPLFATKLGDMMISSCESNDNAHLKFALPEGIDVNSVKVSIKYTTGS